MSFKNVQIRYQTAAIMPGPFAHFYTLTLTPTGQQTLRTAITIDYPDREELDEEDIVGEGFTLDDTFSWEGELPQTWLEAVTPIATSPRLKPLNEADLGENDDFFEISFEGQSGQVQLGTPTNREKWQYLAQELIQATYEAAGRENPFELIYVENAPTANSELRLTASFARRTLTVATAPEPARTLPWDELQRIMSKVYSAEYNPDEALMNRPKQDGRFVNMGTDEWYNISDQPALHKLFKGL